MQTHTVRERDAWLQWIDEHWYEMSLTDYYLQQVAVEVRRGYVKHPGKVKAEHLKLQFKREQKSVVQDPKTATAIAKARWYGITGYKGKD